MGYSPWGHTETDTTERFAYCIAYMLGLLGGLVHVGQCLARVESLAGPAILPFFGRGGGVWSMQERGALAQPQPHLPPLPVNPVLRPHQTIPLFSHLQRPSHIPELKEPPLFRMSFLTSAQAECYLLSEAASSMLPSLIPPPEATWLLP